MDTESPLVLAMPRRELFRVSGFTKRVDFGVLASVADEAWYAAPDTLIGNLDAKEVRLGLVVARPVSGGGEEVLVHEGGVLLHATPIPPEVGEMGPGLRALRKLALAAGGFLLGLGEAAPGRVELVGYLNDDALPECRECFILVYRLQVAADHPAPLEMQWTSASGLEQVPLDPVSVLIAAGWAQPAAPAKTDG
ncbi:MAG: hypothetical protein H0X38_17500 [Planctomycetes bacterium]|nr:hypothetical protein [Planctomycetota bacterium]